MEHDGKDLRLTKYMHEDHARYMSEKAKNFQMCRR